MKSYFKFVVVFVSFIFATHSFAGIKYKIYRGEDLTDEMIQAEILVLNNPQTYTYSKVSQGHELLIQAVKAGNANNVRLLFKYYKDNPIKNYESNSLATYAAIQGNLEVVKAICELPGGLDSFFEPDKFATVPFGMAIEYAYADLVRFLLPYFPNINAKIGIYNGDVFSYMGSPSELTPNQKEVLAILIRAGANPFMNTGYSNKPHWEVMSEPMKIEIAKIYNEMLAEIKVSGGLVGRIMREYHLLPTDLWKMVSEYAHLEVTQAPLSKESMQAPLSEESVKIINKLYQEYIHKLPTSTDVPDFKSLD